MNARSGAPEYSDKRALFFIGFNLSPLVVTE